MEEEAIKEAEVIKAPAMGTSKGEVRKLLVLVVKLEEAKVWCPWISMQCGIKPWDIQLP